MKNSHIAFISFPHHPHIGPTLPIIATLTRRGHRVTCAASSKFMSRIQSVGAEPVLAPEAPLAKTTARQVSDVDGPCERYLQFTSETVRQLIGYYSSCRPDLIVFDAFALSGRILAGQLKVPAVQTSPSFPLYIENFSQQVPDPEFRNEMMSGADKVAEFLRGYGVSEDMPSFHREALNIYLFPRAIQPCAEGPYDGCIFAGRCPGEQPYYGSWNAADDGDMPTVLVATSTTYVRGPDYFRMCIEAFSGLGWKVILSIGETLDPASLGPLPQHFEIVQNVSHVKILPHVSLFVCLGGIITTAEAMYHGVPLIATTHGVRELEWEGDNIANLGIGVHLKKSELTAQNLRSAAVSSLKDHELRKRVLTMQRAVKREFGAEEVANAIEDFQESHA